MYTKESIDKVRDLDIVQVISKYIELKPAGASFKAKSPFKEEKTASMMVSPAKQIFKCFASGFGGNGIDFCVHHFKDSFIDAVKRIANDNNVFLDKVEQTKEAKARSLKKEEFYNLAKSVQLQYVKQIKALEPNHWSIKMLEERGYDNEVILEWQLGYADNSGVITSMAKEKAFLGPAKEIGVVSGEQNNSYDFFRDRIIFPIYNHNGTCVGFGGRRKNGDEKSAKYINSIESDIYQKKETLYGLHLAKTPIRKKGYAILTEGYTDVITMHKFGADTTIATCGTALTPEQAKLLKNYCQRVYIMRDGDAAGTKATERDVEIFLKFGFKVSVYTLPMGEDPDTYAPKFKDIEKEIMQRSVDAVIWTAKRLEETFISESYLFECDNIDAGLKTNIESLLQNKKSTEELNAIEDDDERKGAVKYNAEIDKEIDELEKEAKKQKSSLIIRDAHKVREGQSAICKLLHLIRNQTERDTYLTQVSKILGIKAQLIKQEIARLELKASKERKTKKLTPAQLGLPQGCTQEHAEFFDKYRFLEYNKQYYFQKKEGIEAGSNYILKPLYHINGKEENKRLCEIENIYGQRQLIDFDSESFVSLNELKRELIKKGNFLFTGVTTVEFELLVQRLMSDFDEALPLVNLGQNHKGFFAFANGIVKTDFQFEKANKYGVIHVPNEEDELEKDEEFKAYEKNVEYYFTPAFSAMHRYNQKGDDPYENDRQFVFKQANMTLSDWQNHMVTVFGDKGKIGVVFTFASLFRDLFLNNYSYFPLLGGFGEKGTGKSGLGECIQNFFFFQQRPLDLTQATPVGFSRRVARVSNVVTFLDEYKESGVDDRLKSGMMGAWNGNGREKGTLKKGATETDVINTAMYISGQFLPTYQDNALVERMIVLNFPNKEFTEQEKNNYNQFLQDSKTGISSLILDILKCRPHFQKNLIEVYKITSKDLKASFKSNGIKERIIQNYLALLTTYQLLSDAGVVFPFDYADFKTICIKGIQSNSEAIQDSDTTMEFWKSVQSLFESSFIKEGYQYGLDSPVTVKILKDSKNTTDWQNEDRKTLLFLRLNVVHPLYSKYCQQTGKDILPEGTLRGYLKSRPYYIGAMKTRRFKGTASSCFVFDYTMMSDEDNLIISLEKLQSSTEPKQKEKDSEKIEAIEGVDYPKQEKEFDPDDIPI